jgi:hypothetical protein
LEAWRKLATGKMGAANEAPLMRAAMKNKIGVFFIGL